MAKRKSEKQLKEELLNCLYRYAQVFGPESHKWALVIYGQSGRVEDLVNFLDTKCNEKTAEKENVENETGP